MFFEAFFGVLILTLVVVIPIWIVTAIMWANQEKS